MAKRPPKYALHKPTGQAYVRINGKFHYLGEHDSAESHERYNVLIAKWLGDTFDADMESLTIARLAILFIEHARQYYRKDGRKRAKSTAFRRHCARWSKSVDGKRCPSLAPGN